MLMVTQMSFLMLTALTADAASSAVPDLKLPAALAQVKPGVDLGVGMGVQKGPASRAVLPRIHLKF